MNMNTTYIIGVDFGQRRDYTALALLARTMEQRDPLPGTTVPRAVSVYTMAQLDRVRQESYEAVADSIARLLRRPELGGATLVVDETGVGAGVTDMLRARRLTPYCVTITGAERVTREGMRLSVPKKDLVLTVDLLLEARRLRIPPELPDARTLIEELHNFQRTVRLNGHEAYGAGTEWREGAHDDLVLATAMGVWFGETGRGRPFEAIGGGVRPVTTIRQ